MPTESFRDRLLSTEPLAPELQSTFDREIEAIMNPKLTRIQRWYYVVFLVALGVVGVTAAIMAAVFRADPLAVGAGILVAVGALLAAAFVIHVLRRGAEDFTIQVYAGKTLPGFALAVACGLLFYSTEIADSPHLLWPALGVLFFLLTSFINLYNRIVAAERTNQEYLLRLEYRLAEMAERMAK